MPCTRVRRHCAKGRHAVQWHSRASSSGDVVPGCAPQVGAHIQEDTGAMTFDDTLARAMGAKAATREREEKRLAFYIFWNAKSEFTRCG